MTSDDFDLSAAAARTAALSSELSRLEMAIADRLVAAGWYALERYDDVERFSLIDPALPLAFDTSWYDFTLAEAAVLEAAAPDGWHEAWRRFAIDRPLGNASIPVCRPAAGVMPPSSLDDLTDEDRRRIAGIEAAHQMIRSRRRPDIEASP